MTDTTTIQTTEAQAQFLEDMGRRSKKAALQELIDSYDGVIAGGIDDDRVREIARDVVRVREALE